MKGNKILFIILFIILGVGLFFIRCVDSPSLTKEAVKDKIIDGNGNKDTLKLADYQDLLDSYSQTSQPDSSVVDDFDDQLESALSEIYGVNFASLVVVERAKKDVELPVKVAIYLDNSSSMEGYLNPKGGEEITGVIDVINGIKGFYSENVLSAYTVNKDDLKEENIESFTTKITNKKSDYYDAVSLDGFLSKIAEATLNDKKYNRINFFITDGIPSGTNDEIKNSGSQRNFNINNASTLENRIADAIRPLEKQGGYGVIIYQFTSHFNGKYFDYTNGHHNLKEDSRPYYVVVIGKQEQLKTLGDCDRNISNFKYKNRVQMISKLDADDFVPGSEHRNNYSDGHVFLNDPDGNMLSEKLSFDLNTLPEYLRDKESIKKSFKIKIDGQNYALKDTDIDNEYVYVPLIIDFGMQREIEVEMIDSDDIPHWVSQYTTMDDLNISQCSQKTFELDVFVNGLKKGIYNMKTNNLLKKKFIIDYSNSEI